MTGVVVRFGDVEVQTVLEPREAARAAYDAAREAGVELDRQGAQLS